MAGSFTGVKGKSIAGRPVGVTWRSATGSANSPGSFNMFRSPKRINRSPQDEYDAARAANEGRYSDLLGAVDTADAASKKSHEDVMGQLAGLGEAQRGEINRTAADAVGRTQQSAIGQGTFYTSNRLSQERRVDESKNRALLDMNELLSRLRAGEIRNQQGVDLGVARDRFNIMEGRTDAYPDLNAIAALTQAAGAANVNYPLTGFGGSPGAGSAVGPNGYTGGAAKPQAGSNGDWRAADNQRNRESGLRQLEAGLSRLQNYKGPDKAKRIHKVMAAIAAERKRLGYGDQLAPPAPPAPDDGIYGPPIPTF